MVHSTHNVNPAQAFVAFILVPISPPDSCKADVMITQNCFWSLSKKPRFGVREFSRGSVKWRISASSEGMPTINDKDLLIYLSSLIIDAKNKGLPYSKRVRINVIDFLRFCKPNQDNLSGNYYTAMLLTLRRLAGSLFETTIRREVHEIKEGFSLISSYKIIRKGDGGGVVEVEVELSDWIFNALEEFHVLTYDPRYFLLGPLERQVYCCARSFCGKKNGWIKKTAKEIKEFVTDQGTVAKFKMDLKKMERSIPGYIIKYVQLEDKKTDYFYIMQADDEWNPDRNKIMQYAERFGLKREGEQILRLVDGLI